MDTKDSDSPSVDVASTSRKDMREIGHNEYGEVLESKFAGRCQPLLARLLYFDTLTTPYRSVALGLRQNV